MTSRENEIGSTLGLSENLLKILYKPQVVCHRLQLQQELHLFAEAERPPDRPWVHVNPAGEGINRNLVWSGQRDTLPELWEDTNVHAVTPYLRVSQRHQRERQ